MRPYGPGAAQVSSVQGGSPPICLHADTSFPLPALRESPHFQHVMGTSRRSFGRTPAASPSRAPAHSRTNLQPGRTVQVPNTADWPWVQPPCRHTSRPTTPEPSLEPLSCTSRDPACSRSPAHSPPTPPEGRPCGPMASARDPRPQLQSVDSVPPGLRAQPHLRPVLPTDQ